MKKITLIFFTFSGIYAGFAQKPAETTDSIHARENVMANTPPTKIDSMHVKEKSSIRLYPNPAKNKVEIEIKAFDPGYVKIQLIDNKGKLVREERRLIFSGNEIIILMFSEKPGLYFLVVKQGNKLLKNKLIIQ